MRRRLALFPVLAVAALLLAACGSSSSTSGAGPAAGASIAPASAPVFVTIDSDPGSAQWKQVDALLDKFPGKDKLITAIEKELTKQGVSYEQDIKPALGPEVDIAVLGLQEGSRDVVGMVQPQDKAKLQALLDKLDQSDPSSKTVTAEYKGWTLVSDKQSALDTFEAESAKGAIADDATYQEALANEAGDSLATAYVNGAALQQLLQQLGSQLGTDAGCGPATTQTAAPVTLRYISGAFRAESKGLRLHATIQSEHAPSSGGGDTKALLSEIPSGSLLVLAFHGSDQFTQGYLQLQQACPGQLEKAFGQFESLLGVKLGDIAALLKNETAVYVRTGSPIPEVTFVSHQADAQTALGTLDTLAKRLGDLFGAQPHDTTIDGTPAKELVVGGRVSIYYAAFDGKVVVTDAQSAIGDLKDGGGAKLKDDPTFQDASKVSGMPDGPGFFLYLNLKDGIPYVESFARLAGASIPPDVEENLRPLTSFVLYGAGTNEKLELTAFLELQ
jgi:Protein of unknown function (DUF3352)